MLKNRRLKTYLTGIAAVILLTVTYWTNCIDRCNAYYGQMASNSELLVLGSVYHKYRGGSILVRGYGLGFSVPANMSANLLGEGNYLTDEISGFVDGYNIKEPMIAVANNEMDREIYTVGNVIEFATGMKYRITEVSEQGNYFYVKYDSETILDGQTGGTLELARVFDADGNLFMNSIRGNYESQYGLQGKVFGKIAKLFPILKVHRILRLLCAFATAVIMTAICFLLKKKYNLCMALIFFAVFWLSPWIVGFASNLYWLEALLFFPMLIGVWCAAGIGKCSVRILSYVGIFLAIFIKSLCGYEYLTVVMMSVIVFLLADAVMAFIEKADRKKKILLIRTIFILGVCALLGFAAALLIHARIRGNGNIAEGLRSIYNNDVLRRTLGGNANNFDPVCAESLNASIGSVIATYFDFSNSPYETQLILGISGKLFPVLAFLSTGLIVLRGLMKKKLENLDVLYFWMFLSCISWFVLGKAHSVIHTHLNYLMWYFGYVQMMFYVICRSVIDLCKKWKSHDATIKTEESVP